MAHDLKTNDLAAKAAVVSLKERMTFIRNCKRLEPELFDRVKGSKPGESIRLTQPARFTVRTGDAMNPQNIIQPQVTLTMLPLKGVDVEVTDRQWKLDLADFKSEVLDRKMDSLAANLDSLFMQLATLATANAIGTPGANPSTMLTFGQARRDLIDHGAPDNNLKVILPTDAMAAAVNANEALQHPGPEISKEFIKGVVTRAAGFTWYETTSNYRHTTGTATSGTPLVNGASQSGSSLITNGWDSGTSDLTAGDVFWIDDVFSVHPQNRVSTGINQRFVVTTAISDTAGAMTISIDPPIKGPGDPHQNVSALPADDAALVLQGSTVASPVQNPATASAQGLAFHDEAFRQVFLPLDTHRNAEVSQMATDPDTGIAVRVWQDGDIRQGSRLCRIDVLAGFVAVYPELAERVYCA